VGSLEVGFPIDRCAAVFLPGSPPWPTGAPMTPGPSKRARYASERGAWRSSICPGGITRHYGLDTEVPPLQPARAPPWIQDELDLGMVDEPMDDTDVEVDPNPDGFIVDPPDDDGLPIFIVD